MSTDAHRHNPRTESGPITRRVVRQPVVNPALLAAPIGFLCVTKPLSFPFIEQVLIGALEAARRPRLIIQPVMLPAGGIAEHLACTKYAALLITGDATAADVTAAQNSLLPTACIGRSDCNGPDILLFANDDYGGASAVVEHLRSFGHRDIALLGGPTQLQYWRDRQQGWQDALVAGGLTPGPVIIAIDDEPATARAAFLATWKKGFRPTAIFAGNDQRAAGIYAAAQQLGLRIPNDLSIVGFDDIEAAARLIPPLTTMQTAKQALGMAAIEAIVRLSDGEPVSGRRLPVRLITRASVASPRSAQRKL